MNYFDFAVAVGIFLFFIAMVLTLSTNYFSNIYSLTRTSEFRSVAESLFKPIFGGKGIPENWHQDSSVSPVQIGLAEDLYLVHFLVKEDTGLNRTNEPVIAHIIFDENCQNESWNNTIRMYDEDNKELNIKISNTTFCTSQYLNQSDITWEVNISANQAKKYYLYYSPDDVTNPNYPSLSYNTSSWIPSDGDAWTETTADWSREGGTSGTPTDDTVTKIRGNSSVNITDTFNAYYLGLEYNPENNINGINNSWYLDVWLYVDDFTDLNYIYLMVAHNMTSYVYTTFSGLISGVWYHFERQLDPSLWTQFGIFDAAEGIDRVIFDMYNSTPDLTRTLKIDGLHFKKKSLEIKTFPEEKINAVSSSKFDLLKNLSYDEVRDTLSGNYEFRIDVGGDTYGEEINQLTNVGCYESPQIIEYKNGTIKNIMARVCVGK